MRAGVSKKAGVPRLNRVSAGVTPGGESLLPPLPDEPALFPETRPHPSVGKSEGPRTVGLSEDHAVVGAPGENGQAGGAYVYLGLAGLDCNTNGRADSCDIFLGASSDSNNDAIPDECRCIWDLDGDSVVGIADLLNLFRAWGTNPEGPPDFDGDGIVGIIDLLRLLANWGSCL